MARKPNYEIRELKKAMGVKWADVITQTGLSESYFYTLLKTEMSAEYEKIVRDAIMKTYSDAERPEKKFRELFSETKKELDLQTKSQMIEELCAVVEKYQTQGRERFNISKTKKEGENV